MKIKENYTREEADFMSLVSSLLGENPQTFQGNEAFWSNVSVDFENKELSVYPDEEGLKDILYYLMAGVSSIHGYKFSERL